MQSIHFHNPSIIICEWFPMGRSNMISLNKLIEAHKRFNSPTEYGMGLLEDEYLNKGCYTTTKTDFFIIPVNYGYSEFLKAEFSNNLYEGHVKGIEIDKDGACYIGMSLNEGLGADILSLIDDIKIEFANQFVPLLADNQVDLLNCAYGVEDILESPSISPSILPSYSLVISKDIGLPIISTKEFLENSEYRNILIPVTDWIISHFSIDNCHIFIGMKAIVCIGVPSDSTKKLLKEILFQRTMMDISLKMFSTLWVSNKSLGDMSSSMLTANYKELKRLNKDLGKINSDLSRQNIFSEMMTHSVKSKMFVWESLISNNPSFMDLDYGEDIKVELEKAEDRNLIIKQMYIDIEGLRGQFQQQMNLIMTKNGERLNLIIFFLTIMSVIGFADILGFSIEQIILTASVATPFILFLMYWIRRYYRDYD